MEEVRYYISDDGKFRADNPEEVIKYEEETERQLKEELQKLSEFYAAEEVGYIAIINHEIGITYFGPSKPSILEKVKNKLIDVTTNSKFYGYIVDKKDINTKIYEVNKR
nr:MAG TPA: hypothetical protein [Caudoviricetes sp.]